MARSDGCRFLNHDSGRHGKGINREDHRDRKGRKGHRGHKAQEFQRLRRCRVVAESSPWRRPWRWARNQAPTATATPPNIRSSWPTTRVGRIVRATPPRVIAALVVMLPIMALRGGQANEATPKTKRATPTQTMLLRLESFAPSSRAVSFWAAPNSA